MKEILKVKNVIKYYGSKSNLTKAVDDISFSVEEGQFVAIIGASGSGKTTQILPAVDAYCEKNHYKPVLAKTLDLELHLN